MVNRYSKTEREGINAVEAIVLNQLDWIFREQPIVDMGIDAHIEVVDNNPTGKLIGVQVKTGKGNFYETKTGYVYYGTTVHLDYWKGHSLPVILVAHIPETKETLWAQVNEKSVERTENGWKIEISKMSVFGEPSRKDLLKISDSLQGQMAQLMQLAEAEKVKAKAAGKPATPAVTPEKFGELLSNIGVPFFPIAVYVLTQLSRKGYDVDTIEAMTKDAYTRTMKDQFWKRTTENHDGVWAGVLMSVALSLSGFGVATLVPANSPRLKFAREYEDVILEKLHYMPTSWAHQKHWMHFAEVIKVVEAAPIVESPTEAAQPKQ